MSTRSLFRTMARRVLPRSGSTAGFTLIELMVAMLLGLIVIAGVVSVFLANQRSYRTNQALGDVQDGSRIAFEMLARDIRDAGATGCDNSGRVANVLNNGATDWWANWGNALRGYGGSETDPAVATGTSAGTRVSGTDSLTLIGGGATGLSVASHNPTSAQFKLNQTSSDLQSGDVVLVCDPNHASLMQITNYNNSNVTLVHNTGTGTPGNCSKGLGFPTDCSSVNGNGYEFGPNSQLFKLSAVDWFIGNNPPGGRSLYRMNVSTVGGVPTAQAQEMVRDVTAMGITYHQAGSAAFVAPTAVTNWAVVDAVRVTLTLQSVDKRAGTDVQPIQRTFTATTTVRNRVK
ncbi:MAG TPA: prepilin-type N-terminal cleavage/methylation domain-containing protein [Rhodanobacter sp.]